MVYFHDWPDVTIHTNKDLPENLDATKLQRVAFLRRPSATLSRASAPEAALLAGRGSGAMRLGADRARARRMSAAGGRSAGYREANRIRHGFTERRSSRSS
jgi:hypothetical protein